MDWGKLTFALWYRHTRGMSAAEKGDYMDEAVDACVDEARGVSPLADAMMEEAEGYVFKKRDAGRLGGLAKARNAAERARAVTSGTASESLAPPSTARKSLAPLESAKAPPSTALAKASTPLAPPSQIRKKENNIPPESPPAPAKPPERSQQQKPQPANPKPSTKSHVDGMKGKRPQFSRARLAEDKYAYLNSIDNVMLSEFALWYCEEQDNARARNFYDRWILRHGWKPFRAVLEKFVGDTESGEEPAVRGAAFMATLQRAAQTENNGGGNAP